jgi:hypothetical protein
MMRFQFKQRVIPQFHYRPVLGGIVFARGNAAALRSAADGIKMLGHGCSVAGSRRMTGYHAAHRAQPPTRTPWLVGFSRGSCPDTPERKELP